MQENTETTRKLFEAHAREIVQSEFGEYLGFHAQNLVLKFSQALETAWAYAKTCPQHTGELDRVKQQRDEARALYAQSVGYGKNAHAGVWISDEEDRSISSDGP